MKTLNPRPSKHEYFMLMAMLVSTRATCLRRRTGCVLVDFHGRILATGYNGVPAGADHCETYGHLGCYTGKPDNPSGSFQGNEVCRAVHAEQNALMQAAGSGVNVMGAVCYSTNEPCIVCTKLLASVGIKEVYFIEKYEDQSARNYRNEIGMSCELITYSPSDTIWPLVCELWKLGGE